MHFTTAFVASAAALTASALPQLGAPINGADRFGVITIRSGSPIQNAAVQAAHRGLMVGAANQNATCDKPTNSATFYISEGELWLENASHAPDQGIYVDRSGMGQGLIAYTTGAEPISRNGERKGWAIGPNNELQFDGTGLQACPGDFDGGWSLWLQGLDKPGFIDGCLSVTATAIKTNDPIGCLYTQE